MDSPQQRIEQFTRMTEADPANELGHFSLGKALLEAGRAAEAEASLRHALRINHQLTRAHQALAEALLRQNRPEDAATALLAGIAVADARGDLQPRAQMAELLRTLGHVAPEPPTTGGTTAIAGQGEVACARCGNVGKQLARPPFTGQRGQRIYEKICADCWSQWIEMGTKVINELRLPMNDPQAQKLFEQHMLEFLNLK